MGSGMPELGSKISLISKADIRYEGRLFTVDPQECTIALANVRSFGTEDRDTQFPVVPQSQVYDYILFRGADIKDIHVVNNVPSLPNDPAIMQMSIPPSLGAGPAPARFPGHFNHPVVGQQQYPQYHPMAGFQGGVHGGLTKTSELSPQSGPDLAPGPMPAPAPIGSQPHHLATQMKDQGSISDIIGGGSQQTSSRSATPGTSANRKSPTNEQGTQVGASGTRGDTRRSSNTNKQQQGNQQQPQQSRQRTNSGNRNRQRYPSQSGQSSAPPAPTAAPAHHSTPAHYNQQQQQQQGQQQGYNNNNRGGWRGRSRGRGRGFVPRNSKTLKFENDYDFEQANTEFEELRNKLAKAKIADGTEDKSAEGEVEKEEKEKKEDSGNETGGGEPEPEDDGTAYDKTKSFFDNISCEAVERSKGRSQRTDWRTERKLNSETFGVASARRGMWRGRGGWRYPPHTGDMNFNAWTRWRPLQQPPRGAGAGRGGRPTQQYTPRAPLPAAH